MSASTKQVLLFPFPGKGHLTAFLSLAGLIHRVLPSAAITMVSTPRNVAALRAAAPPLPPFLNLHALRFDPVEHGLPADYESPDRDPALIVRLFEAFEKLQPAFEDFVASAVAGGAGRAAVVIVSDAFLAWTVDVARRRGCGHALFVSCGAFGSAVVHSLFSHMPLCPEEPSGRVVLPEYPDVVIHRSQVSKYMLLHRQTAGATSGGGGGQEDEGYFDRQLRHGYNTDAVLINTVEELEPAGLAMLRRTLKVPVWPIGPLSRAAESEPASDGVLRWMDAQPPASVLYISFGTNGTIRAEHMLELAAALESTGRRFVWKVRPPGDEPDLQEDDDSWLPEGFLERVTASNKGFLVRGWAPQVRILAHASTAAFLSHCGWNSVLESMAHGVPIIGWPIWGEQFYNAMLLEELGVCVEVARGNAEDTVVDRERVAQAVETAMGGETTAKGKDMRRRMEEVQRVMADAWREDSGSSCSRDAFQTFLEAMKLS